MVRPFQTLDITEAFHLHKLSVHEVLQSPGKHVHGKRRGIPNVARLSSWICSQRRTGSEMDDSVSTNKHFENRQLLFINRYSVDQACRAHCPDKKTISTHVQRTIRQKKRANNAIKLRSTTIGKAAPRSCTVDLPARKNIASPSRWCLMLIHDHRSEARVTNHEARDRTTPSTSDKPKLENLDRQVMETSFRQTATQRGEEQMPHSRIPDPTLGVELLDTVVSGGLPKSKVVRTALQFCESAHIP